MRLPLASALARSRTGLRSTFGAHAALRLRCAPKSCLNRPWSGSDGTLHQRRGIHDGGNGAAAPDASVSVEPPKQSADINEFKKYFAFSPQSPPAHFKLGKTVSIHGYLAKRRDMHSKLSFVKLLVEDGPEIKFMSQWEEPGSPEHQVHQSLRSAPSYSSVCLTGRITKRSPLLLPRVRVNPTMPKGVRSYELSLEHVQVLSPFPKEIIVSDGVRFPPSSRHLQLRFSQALRNRLRVREHLQELATKFLGYRNFHQMETPILFKSTPEGAREFLVPTRRAGYAYALPQSPQQYKQILMASGYRGYFQFARCFRDEDLRADRQPEFTQLDLEMSFATGEEVMRLVESMTKHLYNQLHKFWRLKADDGEIVPVLFEPLLQSFDIFGTSSYPFQREWKAPFLRLAYQDAMALYGSDKPDLRIENKIQRMESVLPDDFIGKITHLENPVVEALKFRLKGTADEINAFVKKFFDSLPTSLAKNPDGQPAVMICQPSKPLNGFSPLGHDVAGRLLAEESKSEFPHLGEIEEGDILIFQARENKPFHGSGSTALGNLRLAMYHAAVEAKLLPRDRNFKFLWVTGFPMFTPNNGTDPGQGGAAGFSATHHPFTAPKTPKDFELLATDPLKAEADHYDLVVNGVELGGGSRRIHIPQVQEYVLRDILKMDDKGVAHFAHLIEALRAGCPPHAGFAFGWDRLIATLTYTNSVRDVIAFPKSMKGEEMQTKSPGKITSEQLETYHLAFRGKKAKTEEEPVVAEVPKAEEISAVEEVPAAEKA